MIRFTDVTEDDKKKEPPAKKTVAPVADLAAEETKSALKPAAKRKIANPASKKAAAKD